METATRYGSKPNVYPASVAKDVTLEVTMKGEGPRMGEDAQLYINMKNCSSAKRSTILHSQVAVMYYTGVQKAMMKKDDTVVELTPNEGETLVLLFAIRCHCIHTVLTLHHIFFS